MGSIGVEGMGVHRVRVARGGGERKLWGGSGPCPGLFSQEVR